MTVGLAALVLGLVALASPSTLLGTSDAETCLTCTTDGTTTGGPPVLDKLTVSVTGPGTVTAGSSQNCTSTCTWTYADGSQVTLTETPDTGYTFMGWGGACTGTASSCSVPMDADQSVTASFADTTPPAVPTIVSPAEGATSTSGSQVVSFVSSDSDTAGFLCRVDVGPMVGCSSPWSTGVLDTGQHHAYVYAKDAAGNISSPASVDFRVVNLPDTTIDGTPAEGALVNTGSTAFDYTATVDGASFSCELDGVSVPCNPNLNVADGAHTLSVKSGIDPFGDGSGPYYDATPAVRHWTVDSQPPDTSIGSGPPAATTATTAQLAFSGQDPAPGTAIHFECRLDAGAYQPCTSPVTYSGLGLGAHTASVRAVDAAGNVDPTPASSTWNVEKPAVTLPKAPGKLAAVKWRAHGSRTELRTLTLTRLAAGSKVAVTCTGSGCPFKHRSAKVSGGRAKLAGAFAHRALRPKTHIQLQITAPGYTARIIKITILAHRKPLVAGG